MKKMIKENLTKCFGILVMMMVAFAMSSCSSDDDNNTPAWNSLQGEYTGWTSTSFSYSTTPMATDGEKVTFAVSADGVAKVQLVSNQWGTSTFDNVTVTEQGNDYALSGSGKASLSSHGGEAKEYDATLSGSISKDKKTANIVVKLPAVMGGTTITFANGSAPLANLLAGSYSGWTSASFKYSPTPMATDGESFSISVNEDGTASLTYTSDTWGTVSVENLSIEKSADGYAIAGNAKTVMGMGEKKTEYEGTVSGTISADKSTCSIVFSVPAVMGGLTITLNNGSAPLANLLAGSYSGWTSASFKYSPTPMITDKEKIAIAANEDGTASLTYTSETWGTATINGLTIEKTDAGYSITGEGKIAMSMNGGEATEYDCNVSGTISADKDTYTIQLDIPAVMGGTKVTFKEGSAPSTEA